MSGSEVIAIIVKCGGCEATVVAEGATFEVEREDLCNACQGIEGCLTCFCNGGQGAKSLDFSCPKCKYCGSIEVI